MIILHYAISENLNKKVYGYALRENGRVFIVQEDGTRIPVKAETVMPYQACHRLEDHISLTENALAAFHEQKIYYLEDIAERGAQVLESVRGIGPLRRKAILEMMEQLLSDGQ